MEPISQQLQLKMDCRDPLTQLSSEGKLLKMAKLYANAFADEPWNEYKVCQNEYKICQNNRYFGLKQSELKFCTNCNSSLKEAYPEKETADNIMKEVTRSEGTLITFEDENQEVLAAGWGYACTLEELQAKYDKMKERVVSRIREIAEGVQRVFYLSEIMVSANARNKGYATKITNELLRKAEDLKLKAVMRTRNNSPMVRIAIKTQMSRIIGLGPLFYGECEDTDDPCRVLYIKI